ncbi:MAG TPA: hypothetical protein VER17_04010 [Tepidisphaeraceae bacterium]|nr:hypothetical protein [Tepidisphaeraceae bacterium]
MKSSPDPVSHRKAEERFVAHVDRLLRDERLRIDVARGWFGRRVTQRSVTLLSPRTTKRDRAVDVKRLMIEMGAHDHDLQNNLPIGQAIDIDLARVRWKVFRTTVGYLRVLTVPPVRELIAGRAPAPLSRAEVERQIAALPAVSHGVPVTTVVLSTSGFEDAAHTLAARTASKTVILVEPNAAGGYTVIGPPETAAVNELFDPEGDEEKRARVRQMIESSQMELSGSGVSAERIVAKTQLPAPLVEGELKSYAKENPGLAAKRLDGRLVLFREGSSVVRTTPAAGGLDMPMIDRIKSLFNRRGETEKKIAFLSERRAALGQQRDHAYEEIAHLETKDGELREQFKNAGPELIKRRITSQLLQLRKDIERRQQLLNVLNQQMNVVATHLHNLELVQQGESAKLPDSEEMAGDAAAAEEMLATLQESTEMAESVGGVGASSMSDEEEALYEELMRETGAATAPGETVKAPKMGTGIAGATETASGQRITPPIMPAPERERERRAANRNEPEAG